MSATIFILPDPDSQSKSIKLYDEQDNTHTDKDESGRASRKRVKTGNTITWCSGGPTYPAAKVIFQYQSPLIGVSAGQAIQVPSDGGCTTAYTTKHVQALAYEPFKYTVQVPDASGLVEDPQVIIVDSDSSLNIFARLLVEHQVATLSVLSAVMLVVGFLGAKMFARAH